MSDLSTIREGWEQASDDAMFNILTLPGKQDGGWDPDEFFATGQIEINEALDRLDSLGLRGAGKARALDFGCGVGRLTQALAAHYTQATGVDVSRSMAAQARRYARQRGCACLFVTNSKPHLRIFYNHTFDLVYSVLTLQHMPNDLQRGYVQEFPRLLKRDGVAVFQLPEGGEYIHPNRWLSMYGASTGIVSGWVDEAGGEVVDTELTHHSGDGWKAWRYTIKRKS